MKTDHCFGDIGGIVHGCFSQNRCSGGLRLYPPTLALAGRILL
jgi:hypothetical protein